MSSGFAMNGICYPSVSDAWTAFASDYPKQDNGNVWYINAPPVLHTSSFDFVVRNANANAGTQQVDNNVALLSCDTNNLQLSPEHSFLLFVGVCIMFALGFIATR